MTHESRLTRELRLLLHSHRTAALGTISDEGHPFVSMVPFAVAPALGCFVIHVSGLAAHTRFLVARPAVSLLVMQREIPGEPVHALPRATLEGRARLLEPDSDEWHASRAAYLQRFPEAEHMTQLGDFRFVAIEVKAARQVAGFGSARSIDEQEVRLALGPEQ
jgi:heme oxygenase (biliverdin-IX-beta and delta-forming)